MFGLFKKRHKAKNQAQGAGDMREVPVNNPLDFREDGSIRPGDPAYDFMMSVFESGKAGIATQSKDGTWDTKFIDDEKENETSKE